MPRLPWRPLHRSLQLGPLLHVQRGGEPSLGSKTSALGPPSANALTHWPIVWASRSNAWVTAAAVQPCASSHTACHRSRSRGVGARYIRLRISASPMRHRSSNAPISCIPNSNPHSNFLILSSYLNRPYPTPTLCGFHLGFGLARIHRSETSVSLTPWMMGKGRRTGLARSQ